MHAELYKGSEAEEEDMCYLIVLKKVRHFQSRHVGFVVYLSILISQFGFFTITYETVRLNKLILVPYVSFSFYV